VLRSHGEAGQCQCRGSVEGWTDVRHRVLGRHGVRDVCLAHLEAVIGLGTLLGARSTPRRLANCRLTCVVSACLIGCVALELARARADCLYPLGQDVSKDEARGRDTSELEGHGHVALLHPCRMLIVITTHPPGLGTLDGCRQTPR